MKLRSWFEVSVRTAFRRISFTASAHLRSTARGVCSKHRSGIPEPSCTIGRLPQPCHRPHRRLKRSQTALNSSTLSLTCKHVLWHGPPALASPMSVIKSDGGGGGELDRSGLTLRDLIYDDDYDDDLSAVIL